MRAEGRTGGLLGSELRMMFGRRRTQVLLVVLAAIPVLLGIAVRLASSPVTPGEGPPFLDQVSHNGVFVAVTGVGVVLPFFLPLAVAVIAGDSIAGEASLGTLRYLLVAPAGRVRLLVVKYAAVAAFCLVAVVVVAVAGLATGAALFPIGRVTLLSGDTVSLVGGLDRTGLVVLYVAASMLGLAMLGMFVSTVTDVPVGAMATVLGAAIISQILDGIAQVSVIHPYLFSHDWLAFGDLLRQPIAGSNVLHGLLVQAGYLVVFASLAWARFTTKDVLS